MRISRLRSLWAAVALTTIVFSVSPLSAEDVKIPQTVADHEALAKSYKDKATEYRKSAAEHKQMAAEYARQHPDPKGSPTGTWSAKMTKHCQMLANDFEKLATDAEKAADYHSLRAKEMQGK